MTKKSILRLLQASLMCCLAVLFTACDDIFASEDNPTPAYLSMSEAPVTLKAGDTYRRKAISVTTAVVEYTSSDTNVATVDGEGVVTAIAEGEATITATATGYSTSGKKIFLADSKSYNVTVLPAIDPKLSTPLTLEALEDGTILIKNPKDGMKYTLNGGAKAAVTTDPINVAEGDKVAFYGSGTSIAKYSGTQIAGGTAEVKVYGNIMSLLDEDNFATATTLATQQTFYGFFFGNNKLIDASGLLLPATTLTDECYKYMFYGCTSLTTAPALPATTLTKDCYRYMFQSCSSLTSAPALPATQLAEGCYTSMFKWCSNLTSAPALPATQLAEGCYNSMFSNCSSLTSAPALPATTLAENCYSDMFYGCSGLTTAPALPATELAKNCYNGMFEYCTSLTAAPALPATQLADHCYSDMFYGCSSLITAPALPATQLANSCYHAMFYGCSSLTAAPALPATQLTGMCYYCMFYNCTSLTTAPALPATQLEYYCYLGMFYNCSNLTTAYVKAGYDDNNCYYMFKKCQNLSTSTLYTDGDWSSCSDISHWQKTAYPTE